MLNKQTMEEIRTLTQDFWEQEVRQLSFVAMATGKEVGHRIADMVDEKTTSFLSEHYETRFEHGKDNIERARSMGDVWVKDNGIFNPINVKTGKAVKGQPNMVAMGKLLAALLAHQIDAYYLLIVNFQFAEQLPQSIKPVVYFVDMLDYLQYMTFQSGPGQIMMKKTKFYNALNKLEQPPVLTLKDKVGKLFVMLEEAEESLIVNRKNRLQSLLYTHEQYLQAPSHSVDQSHLDLRNKNIT